MIKIWLAVLLLVIADSAGNILLARGMKQVGAPARRNTSTAMRLGRLLLVARRAILNPALCLGILCMAITFFSFLALLSWADLSFVLPATSLSYVVSLLGARYILKERVTAARWIGTIVICLGIALISLS
jgi:transporter family protein